MVEASSDLDHTVALELVTSPTITPAKVGRHGEGGGGERRSKKGREKKTSQLSQSGQTTYRRGTMHTPGRALEESHRFQEF